MRTGYRQNSTVASTDVAGSSSSLPEDTLTWNAFLALRKTRRRYNLFFSITTAALTTLGGVAFLSNQEIDAVGGQIFGMDPYVVFGLATASFGVVGWLLGPAVGNKAFAMMQGKKMLQINAVSFLLQQAKICCLPLYSRFNDEKSSTVRETDCAAFCGTEVSTRTPL
jgi:Mitochondrial import protein Pam17